MFSGSYRQEDVQILLKPITLPMVSIIDKERLIQSGARHYSEMISRESLPSATYFKIFEDALARNKQKMAADVLRLAGLISAAKSGHITLVSLARAGTPIGVILKHILAKMMDRKVSHYSVSIIRDRGIDHNAMAYILTRETAESIVFIDGWTGKGVIAQELANSIEQLNRAWKTNISPALYVLSDLAGCAAVAACADDYLIPSSILNSTISGLISRSILNHDYIGKDDFHGCLYYREFEPHDISVQFVEQIIDTAADLTPAQTAASEQSSKPERRAVSEKFIRHVMLRYSVDDLNHIKPGIGEATRVLLRRVPDLLLLSNLQDEDVRHLVILAQEKSVPIIEDAALPYRAVSLIKKVDHD